MHKILLCLILLSGFYGVTWSIGFSIGPTIAGWLQTNVSLSACAGYFLRYVAYFYRFYVLYAMYHPLLCLAEASRLGHLFRKLASCMR